MIGALVMLAWLTLGVVMYRLWWCGVDGQYRWRDLAVFWAWWVLLWPLAYGWEIGSRLPLAWREYWRIHRETGRWL